MPVIIRRPHGTSYYSTFWELPLVVFGHNRVSETLNEHLNYLYADTVVYNTDFYFD